MKILLVSPNREHLPDPTFPLGLAYVAAALKKQGYEVSTLDLCFKEDMGSAIAGALQDFGPAVIGISLRNIDDVAYPKKHSYLLEYKTTVEIIRKYSRAPVVLGGSGFTIMPRQFMEYLGADFGVAGEGEESFPKLIESFLSGGLARGTVLRAPRRITALDRILPERCMLDTGGYLRHGGMLNIQTKRGCAFRCIYCTYPRIEGRKVRMRNPSAVAREIEETVHETGARHFFFVDSVFTHPANHAEEVCREIIRKKLDISWTCHGHPSSVTPRLAALMAKAGCTGVEFGFDSLTDEGLSILGKGFGYGEARQAVKACRQAGMKVCPFLFVGAPGDTRERVMLNLSRLEEMEPDAAVIMAGIRVFPGTRLAVMARRDLGIERPGLDPVFYLSKGIGDMDRIAGEVAKRRRWIMPGYEINVHPRLQRRLRERGIKGPLWEELSKR